MTMTRADMLLKLYDETVKQLHNGVHFIKEKDMASADKCLQKAQNILQYLSSTLDRKYPISNNLASLYRFFKDQIMAASIHRDTKPLESITWVTYCPFLWTAAYFLCPRPPFFLQQKVKFSLFWSTR